MGLFDWFKSRPQQAVSDELWQRVISPLPFITHLPSTEQIELRQLVDRFLQEKEFSSGGGLELNDEICTTIAAQGCLPILKLGLSAYRDWIGIIVYPGEFVVPRQQEDETGIIHEFDDVIAGEAWEGGPLIISWQDVQLADAGYNVVIHEFAHKLDMLNGEADGIPALHSGITLDEWEEALFAAYDEFCQRVDGREETVIDPYASESPGEFFAVLTESFFEIPDVVADEYPALYELFKRFYRQDPLAREMKATGNKTSGAQ